GSLMSQDPLYAQCTFDESIAPHIGSSPNCTTSFVPDQYTENDTCGQECVSKYPESYGLQDFGFPKSLAWKDKVTNTAYLHAYDNIRAVGPGQTPGTLGPIESIPRISVKEKHGILDPEPEYLQIGNFLKLS